MNPYRPFPVRLTRRERLTASMVRITLAGDVLTTCGDILLDQRVKLILGDADCCRRLAEAEDWYAGWLTLPDAERPPMRTYTLSAVRRELGEVDIDVVLHEVPGPGAAFAAKASIGTPVVLVAADRRETGWDEVGVAWRPCAARDLLLVADATALPAVANIARVLPEDRRGLIMIRSHDPADRHAIEAPPGVRIHWFDECAEPAPSGATDMRRLVRDWVGEAGPRPVDPPIRPESDEGDLLWEEATDAGSRYAWIAGEAGWVSGLRRELRAAGFDRSLTTAMGYWKADVAR